MQSNTVDRLGAGTFSTCLLAGVTIFDVGGEVKEFLMTFIPLAVAGLIVITDRVRFAFKVASYSEAQDDHAYQRHNDRIDDKIEKCEKDLQNPLLLDEDRKKLQKNLFELMSQRQKVPSAKQTSRAPTLTSPNPD